MLSRLIGAIGGEKPGPLVIVTAALHGNEPAGVFALEETFQMLRAAHNLDFNGRFVGLIGNLQAYMHHQRFIERDFNRMWLAEDLQRLLQQPLEDLQGEDKELVQLYQLIRAEIRAFQPQKILLLDLHTTSAGGGIFCIPTDEAESLELAKALLAPVILNLFQGVKGTMLRFAAEGHLTQDTPETIVLGVAFEAGQHHEPLSMSRSVSAILHALHFAGCITDPNLRSPSEKILQKSFAELPKVTRLVYAHHIKPDDGFKMRPGYVNFQAVQQGEHLADDLHGLVLSPFDSLILMPLYQTQGSDGFFLVKAEGER